MFKPVVMTTTALTLVAGMAAAQSRVVTAGDRIAADNQPLGVRAGSFLVVPSVDVEGRYDDNIYATDTNEESDVVTFIRPQVTAQSNWSRHALNALARYEAKRHLDNDREDEDNFTLAADGRLDVMRDTSIGGGVSLARTHEDRGEPTALGTPTKPTQVDIATARVGAVRELGRISLRGDIEARKLDFENGVTSGGALVNNNLRDRNEYEYSVRAGYEFTPQTTGFVRAGFDTRSYDFKGNATNVNRSNHGQSLVAGLDIDLSGKTKAEVFVGEVQRDYVDPSLKDTSELTYGAEVTHNLSELTTLTASIDRGIEETTLGASSGYIATSYEVGVEHALRRHLLLFANAGFATNEYQGFAANQREDDITSVGFGADWYINRKLKARAGYEFRDRDSNVAGGDFDRNLLLVRLTAAF